MAKIMTPDYPGGTLHIRYGYEQAGKVKAWFVIRNMVDVGLDPNILKEYGTQWVIWDKTPTEEERRALWDD